VSQARAPVAAGEDAAPDSGRAELRALCAILHLKGIMTLTEVERQTLERYTGRSKGSVNVSNVQVWLDAQLTLLCSGLLVRPRARRPLCSQADRTPGTRQSRRRSRPLVSSSMRYRRARRRTRSRSPALAVIEIAVLRSEPASQ
jgi:hypothetical protein